VLSDPDPPLLVRHSTISLSLSPLFLSLTTSFSFFGHSLLRGLNASIHVLVILERLSDYERETGERKRENDWILFYSVSYIVNDMIAL